MGKSGIPELLVDLTPSQMCLEVLHTVCTQ